MIKCILLVLKIIVTHYTLLSRSDIYTLRFINQSQLFLHSLDLPPHIQHNYAPSCSNRPRRHHTFGRWLNPLAFLYSLLPVPPTCPAGIRRSRRLRDCEYPQQRRAVCAGAVPDCRCGACGGEDRWGVGNFGFGGTNASLCFE